MKILLLICLIWSTNSCFNSQYQDQEVVEHGQETANWKSVNATAGQIDAPFVEFYVPPDFVEKMDGHDYMGSIPKFYGNENVWLVFTIQTFHKSVEDYSAQSDFQSEKTAIDGKQAEIFTFKGTDMVNEAKGKIYVAVLSVPEIQEKTKNLLMWAYSKTQEDRKNVVKIFKSVRFNDK